jgi:hypothetical protein
MDWWRRGSRVGRPVESVGARVGALVSGADRAAGTGVFAPHTYANLSGKEARVLLLCTPAGFERYFGRLAAEYAGVEPRSRAGRSRKRASSAREWSPTPARGAAADAGREDSAMTAQTGESTQRSAGRAIDCARGKASCCGGWRHPNAASPAPSCATVIPADATAPTRAGATSTAA